MNFAKIEKIIGYEFKDKDKLKRALTRKAYAKEQSDLDKKCEDQEIYRTLGDAVLKAILVDLLINSGCTTRDEISKKKKDIEKESTLSKIAQGLGIGKFIILGVGEEKQGASKEPSVSAETLEALVAAIYYDSDYYKTKEIVKKWLQDYLPSEHRSYLKI